MLKLTLFLSLFFAVPAFSDILDDQKPQNINEQMWSSFKSAVNSTQLTPSPIGLGEDNGSYGESIAIDGNKALIGASNSGLVIVLEYDGLNWNQTAVLKPISIYAEGFGSSVSLSGDLALIGNPSNSEVDISAGAAYIFAWDGFSWNETKLLASDASGGQQFGAAVSISGTRALVGAKYGNDNDGYSGSVYMYEFDGNDWIETRISPSDGAMFDLFGASVSIDNNRILIGASQDEHEGTLSGSAYIYDWDGLDWIETKIIASDAADFANFGSSVSVDGNTVVIGANGDDVNGENSGSAYVYQWNGNDWQEQKLVPSDGAANDFFGQVDVNNNRIVIGSISDDDNGNNSGSSYVYDWNGSNWIESKLLASDGSANDSFGSAVALFGDFIFVGAPNDDEGLDNAGSAYIYQWNSTNWDESKQFLSPGSAGDQFGFSVSYSNNRVLIGAPNDVENGITSGSAYIFSWDGQSWNSTKIIPSTPVDFGLFGYAVSIDGDRAAISAIFDTGNAPNSGTVYLYDWDGNNWIESQISATDGGGYDQFGYSVDLSGNRLLVGSISDEDNGPSSGSAYFYDWNGNTWSETKITPSDGASNDYFGSSVNLHEDRALIGATGASTIGAVYLYEWNGIDWNEVKIEPVNQNAGDFGHAVSLNNDRFVVGAPFGYDNGTYFGSAYIYDWDGFSWVETKLNSTNISSSNQYGYAVSLLGNKIVVGNPDDTLDNENYFGSVFIYDWDGNTWSETKLTANNPGNGDFFGSTIQITQDSLVVGARHATYNNMGKASSCFP